MITRKTLARIGAVIALFALLALPLASCREVRLTGTDILLRLEVAPGLKVLIVASLLAAVAAIFVASRWALLSAGAVGRTAFLYAAVAVNIDRTDPTQLRLGSLVTAFGFLLIFIAGFLRDAKKRSP